MIGTGNRWAIHRTKQSWIESRGSGIRHYLDWGENVLLDHDDERLLAQSRRNPAFTKANFDASEFKWATDLRMALGLTNSDLASENSEDAITWSVFRFLEKCPETEWWKLFSFREAPVVSYWPRKQFELDAAATAYRSAGIEVEPYYGPRDRSEIDVLLSTPDRLVMIEAKWSLHPVVARTAPISKDSATNVKIMDHLGSAGASVSARTAADIVRKGGYQLLRHSLYRQHLEQNEKWLSVELVYVVPERRMLGLRGWSDSFELAKEPLIVSWNCLLDPLPVKYLKSSASVAPKCRPATALDYFVTRRLSGMPEPWSPRLI